MSGFGPRTIALVTGAGGDIGSSVAMRLAAEGAATIILGDLPSAADRLEEVRRQCAEALPGDGKVEAVTFDVTDPSSVNSAFRDVVESVGAPNLLFNNAGFQGEFANIVDASLEATDRVLAVNVKGVITVLQAFARHVREAGSGGAAVNTASMAGVGGAPNMVAYSASKGAVIALTKSAAKDLAPLGIRVNSISPAFIGPGAMWDNQVRRQAEVPSIYYADNESEVAKQMIDQVPLRRYGRLDEVAAATTFLLSDDASYLTGVNLEIAGGAT